MYNSMNVRMLLLAIILGPSLMPAQVDTPAPAVPAVPTPAPTRLLPFRPAVPTRSVRAPVAAVPAAVPAAMDAMAEGETNGLPLALKFESTPSDMVLQAYAQETKLTLLVAPDVPKAAITLRSQSTLTREEWLQAIEKVLNMNGIALLPDGEKFLKVVSTKDVRTRAIETRLTEPEKGLFPENGRMISQMIQLKHITIEEARKTLEGFKRADGQIQIFERTNSILITDTAENVNRMLDIIKFVDQPLAVREEVKVRPILYAKAADIKKRLEEIVAESQKQQQSKEAPQAKTTGSPGIFRPVPSPVPGVIRAPGLTPATTPVAENAILEALVGDAERGVIRGKVQIIADERTNKLIIITNPENIQFFESIINVLDVETLPDVKVEVIRMENADSEDVAKMLNELIGNKAKDDSAKPGTGDAAARTPAAQSLADAAARAQERAAERAVDGAAGSQAGKSKIGELSKDNIKILSNKRTNALVIMASAGDLVTLKQLIKGMDIMLSQVLIETIFLEVTLNSSTETGIDWVYRTVNNSPRKAVAWPGRDLNVITNLNFLYSYLNSRKTPPNSGSWGGGGGKTAPLDMTDPNQNQFFGTPAARVAPPSGISYLLTLTGLDVDAIVHASSSDGRTKVLSSPILMTQDNKEATIKATDLIYLYNGQKYTGVTTGNNNTSGYVDDVQQKEVGWTVTVTPRINEKKLVVMTIKETFQDAVPDAQDINGTKWPSITSRELSADVAVANGQTVILGGLVKNTRGGSKAGIPYLSNLPFIGWIFGTNSKTEKRTELLVFLTPYVLDSSDELMEEAKRRRDYMNATGMWTESWSKSKLAEEDPEFRRKAHERALKEEAAAKKSGAKPPSARPDGTVTNLLESPALLR